MPDGYDFSEDDEVLDEQRRGYKDPVNWSNLDEKAIASTLGGLNSKVTACALAVERVCSENDCIKVRDMLDDLKADLYGSGWLSDFYETNKSVFSKVEGNNRPEYYRELSPEDKKKFDAGLQYFRDVAYFQKLRLSMYEIIERLKLVEGFKIDQLAFNLDKAGYNADFYRKIDADVENITSTLNMPWDLLERAASRSKQFLESNRGKLPASELEKRYRDQRLADYRKLVDSVGLSRVISQRGIAVFAQIAVLIDARRDAQTVVSRLDHLRQDPSHSAIRAVNDDIHGMRLSFLRRAGPAPPSARAASASALPPSWSGAGAHSFRTSPAPPSPP